MGKKAPSQNPILTRSMGELVSKHFHLRLFIFFSLLLILFLLFFIYLFIYLLGKNFRIIKLGF